MTDAGQAMDDAALDDLINDLDAWTVLRFCGQATVAITQLREERDRLRQQIAALTDGTYSETNRRDAEALRQLLRDIKPYWDMWTKDRFWTADVAGEIGAIHSAIDAAIAQKGK